MEKLTFDLDADLVKYACMTLSLVTGRAVGSRRSPQGRLLGTCHDFPRVGRQQKTLVHRAIRRCGDRADVGLLSWPTPVDHGDVERLCRAHDVCAIPAVGRDRRLELR